MIRCAPLNHGEVYQWWSALKKRQRGSGCASRCAVFGAAVDAGGGAAAVDADVLGEAAAVEGRSGVLEEELEEEPQPPASGISTTTRAARERRT